MCWSKAPAGSSMVVGPRHAQVGVLLVLLKSRALGATLGISLLGWTPACTGHQSICLTRAHLLFWDATEFQPAARLHTVRSVSRRVCGHSDCMLVCAEVYSGRVAMQVACLEFEFAFGPRASCGCKSASVAVRFMAALRPGCAMRIWRAGCWISWQAWAQAGRVDRDVAAPSRAVSKGLPVQQVWQLRSCHR